MLSSPEVYRCMCISMISNFIETNLLKEIQHTVKTSSDLTHTDDLGINQHAKQLVR